MPASNLLQTSARPTALACPTNQRVGKRVDSLILKAILARPLTELHPVEYRFCADPDCPTVYYSADGLQQFTEADLREIVFQKHPEDGETPVCYCFRFTVGDIRSETDSMGRTAIAERVTSGIQAGQCACDIRNPQGDCCLGNVHRVARNHHKSDRNLLDKGDV